MDLLAGSARLEALKREQEKLEAELLSTIASMAPEAKARLIAMLGGAEKKSKSTLTQKCDRCGGACGKNPTGICVACMRIVSSRLKKGSPVGSMPTTADILDALAREKDEADKFCVHDRPKSSCRHCEKARKNGVELERPARV